MQQAVPPGTGAMSAVMGVTPERLEQLCRDASGGGGVASPANFNAPGQIVVAGHAAAVARLGELVAAEKGRAIPLKVSAPFHCALMAPAARVVEAELARVTIRAPRFPVVANFDARANTDATRVSDLLVRQVDGAVRWDESIRLIVAGGARRALEMGPGRKLGGLVKRIAKELEVLSVDDTPSLEKVSSFLADG